MLVYSSQYLGTGRRCFIVFGEEVDQSSPVTIHVWKNKHDKQGFLWHKGYVGFSLSTGFESFSLEVYLLKEIDLFEPREDVLRSFRLPFKVDKTGYVYIEFSDFLQLEPGNYALFCEMGFREEDIEYTSETKRVFFITGWVRLTFIPQETVEPEILVNLPCPPFNEVLTPQYPLLMEEEPDPNAVSGGE